MTISPDLLDAMLAGERETARNLLSADPPYADYVRRFRLSRRGEPMTCQAFHQTREELTRLYEHTRHNPALEDLQDVPAARAARVLRIYHLERALLAE